MDIVIFENYFSEAYMDSVWFLIFLLPSQLSHMEAFYRNPNEWSRIVPLIFRET